MRIGGATAKNALVQQIVYSIKYNVFGHCIQRHYISQRASGFTFFPFFLIFYLNANQVLNRG